MVGSRSDRTPRLPRAAHPPTTFVTSGSSLATRHPAWLYRRQRPLQRMGRFRRSGRATQAATQFVERGRRGFLSLRDPGTRCPDHPGFLDRFQNRKRRWVQCLHRLCGASMSTGTDAEQDASSRNPAEIASRSVDLSPACLPPKRCKHGTPLDLVATATPQQTTQFEQRGGPGFRNAPAGIRPIPVGPGFPRHEIPTIPREDCSFHDTIAVLLAVCRRFRESRRTISSRGRRTASRFRFLLSHVRRDAN